MRKQTPEEQAQGVKEVQLCFKLNNTMPFTKEYDELVHELFGEFGEGSRLMAPTSVVRGTPDEVGDLAEFLMSSRGRFISGADFLIDGGCTASYWYGDLQYLKATH